MAGSLAQQFGGLRLQDLDCLLRLLEKGCEALGDRLTWKRGGPVKSYVEINGLLILNLRSKSNGERYKLILHRLPKFFDLGEELKVSGLDYVARLNMDIALGRLNGNDNTYGMLPICYLGQSATNVVCGGVPIRSAVWLQREESVPELSRDKGRFPPPIFFQPPRANPPRESKQRRCRGPGY